MTERELIDEVTALAQRAGHAGHNVVAGVLFFIAQAILDGKIGDIAGILKMRHEARQRQ